MPIHDWTRVTAGTFHDFHLAWISELRNALNGGVLPPAYYAQAEQVMGPWAPDVLTLQSSPAALSNGSPATDGSSGLTVATAPPRPRLVAEAEMKDYVPKRRSLVIRHVSDDRVIALLEILSPGNKSSLRPFESFVDKAVEALSNGFHLLIVDLFPPGPRDPNGIHAAIWGEIGDDRYTLPPGSPLTLAAYAAGPVMRAYVEATAVGRELIEMPLFLEPDVYVNVPLEATYRAAYRGVPQRWKQVLE